MKMGKTVWDDKMIAEAIERKVRGIRLKNFSDAEILSNRERTHSIYRSTVMAGENTAEFYVIYKAYDAVARERGLL